jgi:hypothetical protein
MIAQGLSDLDFMHARIERLSRDASLSNHHLLYTVLLEPNSPR